MIRAALLALALLTAPAEAGCTSVATTPVASFREIHARPGFYIMAVGRFSGGAKLDEIYALATDGSETSTRLIAGHFKGLSATHAGFTEPLDADVEIIQRCSKGDCRPVLNEVHYLVFLERVRGRLEFSEDECVLRAYAEPETAALEALTACLNGSCR